MANDHVIVSGLDESLKQLEELGRGGDALVRKAATEAATNLRDTWMLKQLTGGTGISGGVVRKNAKVTQASAKYPGARIFFSSAGIDVSEYNYTRKSVGANGSRGQILVDWVTGGQKVAAGFINQYGKRQMPLSTRISVKNVKSKSTPSGALGPSIAAAYQDLPEAQVQEQAQSRLAERIAYLLDEALS